MYVIYTYIHIYIYIYIHLPPFVSISLCLYVALKRYIYIYILLLLLLSADLFQSESVLAYIVSNQYFAILQTPFSHYCNTLQAPILQIAI